MNRFISFLTGFALTFLCGSLLIIQYRPQLSDLDALVDTNVFERTSNLSVADGELTRAVELKAVELFDATKASLTESIREWEGINVSRYFGVVDDSNPSYAELLARDHERIYEDISAIALAQRKVVADVTYGEKTGWTLTLESGDKVYLGDKDVSTRLNRALTMLEALPTVANLERKLVDARYSNGVAVAQTEHTVVAME